MQCTLPVPLINSGMLLQELIPALILFGCAIALARYGRMGRNKKIAATILLCFLGLAMTLSTAMLAFGSKVVVSGNAITLRAGIYTATLPVASVDVANATASTGSALGRRTNGMSSRGVNAGWFEAADGRKVFAMSSGPRKMMLPTSEGFSVVMDEALYAELKGCISVVSPAPR